MYKLGQLLKILFLQDTKPKNPKSKLWKVKIGHLICIGCQAVKRSSPSNHNCLTTILKLCFPLLDSKIAMPELNILDRVSLMYFIDVEAYQSINRVNPRYSEGKYTLPYRTRLNNSFHNIPTMMQMNHCHHYNDHLKKYIILMNSKIPPPNWKPNTPNV